MLRRERGVERERLTQRMARRSGVPLLSCGALWRARIHALRRVSD